MANGDDEQLSFSPEEMGKLQKLSASLPQGHPLQKKISVVLNAPQEEPPKSIYQRLTERDTTSPTGLRFLSNVGAGAFAAPGAIKELVAPSGGLTWKDFVGGPVARMGLETVEGLRDFFSPSTARGIADDPSVVTDALAMATGNVAAGEAPRLGGMARRGISKQLYVPGEDAFKPGAEATLRTLGGGAGALAGWEAGGYPGAGVGGTLGGAFAPYAARKLFPPIDPYPVSLQERIAAHSQMESDIQSGQLERAKAQSEMGKDIQKGQLERAGAQAEMGKDIQKGQLERAGAQAEMGKDIQAGQLERTKALGELEQAGIKKEQFRTKYLGADWGDPFSPEGGEGGGVVRTSPFDPSPGSRPGGPGVSDPRTSGSEGTAARWTNDEVIRQANAGNRMGLSQIVRRGLQNDQRLNPNVRYVAGDPDLFRGAYNPREVTRFTPEGTPIREMQKPEKSGRMTIEMAPPSGTETRFTPEGMPERRTTEGPPPEGVPERRKSVYEMRKGAMETEAERGAREMGTVEGMKRAGQPTAKPDIAAITKRMKELRIYDQYQTLNPADKNIFLKKVWEQMKGKQ
jgi:hypothetical protein